MKFTSKKPQFEHLRKKWVGRNKQVTENLFDKHLRHIAAGSLGGLMLLTTPGLSLSTNHLLSQGSETSITAASSKNAVLAAELLDKVPTDNRNLSRGEEQQIGDLITKNLGIKVAAEIDGKRLNRTYGLIGGEQHLYRYPGDNVYAHADSLSDWAMYGDAGIAPGLGAWGYFAPSKEQFTPQDAEKERWYVVAQTFLSPGFSERVAEYRDFYKYRKVLVVNPKTGQAVVGDIADSGPGESTGKSFGGSPEVMEAIGLAGGPRKGEVLYFFVDDPQNTVPLGPVKLSEVVHES